jgi:hypothetical protein
MREQVENNMHYYTVRYKSKYSVRSDERVEGGVRGGSRRLVYLPQLSVDHWVGLTRGDRDLLGPGPIA